MVMLRLGKDHDCSKKIKANIHCRFVKAKTKKKPPTTPYTTLLTVNPEEFTSSCTDTERWRWTLILRSGIVHYRWGPPKVTELLPSGPLGFGVTGDKAPRFYITS